MAMFNPNIFRSYDVRGVYRKDFDAEFIQWLGSRAAASFGTGIIVVGRDVRASSDELAYALIDGALHTGAQIIDIGEVSSPQMYWAISELGAVGGLMVTASHNPLDYNGVKAIRHHHGQLHVVGGHHLRQIYDSHPFVHRVGGTLTSADIIGDYAATVARIAGWHDAELQISIDAPIPVRRVLEHIAPIAPDHGLAATFDVDADRIAFYDHGTAIAAEWIFLLLQEQLMLEPVVFDLRFSRVVQEEMARLRVRHTISPVGRLAMGERMRESNAAFGGEMSGHYYWKQFGGMECPELVLLHVAKIVQSSGRSLGQLVLPYERYAKSHEINIPIRDRKAAWTTIHHLKKQYGDAKITELDGLTVEYPNWWFNIRLSNTEPLMRLVVEADTKNLRDQKIAEVQGRAR